MHRGNHCLYAYEFRFRGYKSIQESYQNIFIIPGHIVGTKQSANIIRNGYILFHYEQSTLVLFFYITSIIFSKKCIRFMGPKTLNFRNLNVS